MWKYLINYLTSTKSLYKLMMVSFIACISFNEFFIVTKDTILLNENLYLVEWYFYIFYIIIAYEGFILIKYLYKKKVENEGVYYGE